MKKIRWGIVGAARIVDRMLPTIANADNGELIAIGSRRPGAAKACLVKNAPQLEDEVQTFDGLDQVINHERIGAVYIPLANQEHTQVALRAIRAKKHVLIEKPLAIKIQDVELLIQEAERYQVKLMEGFMYVFHPQFDRMQNIIQSNILGEVNYAHSMFSFPIQPARFYRINREIKDGGGALWDIGPYAIHTLRQCFKENPLRVYAQARLNEHGADISSTGMIDFGSHMRATFDISFACTRRSEFEVFGANGRAKCPTVWQPDDQTAKIVFSTEKSGAQEEIVPKANHFELEFRHFNEAIQKNLALKVNAIDSLWNVRTLVALQESIKSGEWVNL